MEKSREKVRGKINDKNDKLALFSSVGLGKKIELKEIPLQKRGGKGVICYKTSDSTGNISAISLVADEDTVLICGDHSSLCIKASEIPLLARPALGNMIIKNNKIISVSKV